MCRSRSKIVKYMIKDPDCKNKTWHRKELEELIIKKIFSFTLNKDYKENKKKKGEKKKESLIIEKKIKKIEQKINKLLELYTTEDMTGIKEISTSISTLHKEKKSLEEYRKEILKAEEETPEKKDMENYINSISDRWEKSTLQEQRLMLESLIKKIIIKDEEIEVIWAWSM